MLPGYVSGFYTYEDCHIDLGRLSRYAGAELVQQEAAGIDIQVRKGHNARVVAACSPTCTLPECALEIATASICCSRQSDACCDCCIQRR